VCAVRNGIKQDVTHFALSYHAIETLQLCCQLATALEKRRASVFIYALNFQFSKTLFVYIKGHKIVTLKRLAKNIP
jgi:hypothetical protein